MNTSAVAPRKRAVAKKPLVPGAVIKKVAKPKSSLAKPAPEPKALTIADLDISKVAGKVITIEEAAKQERITINGYGDSYYNDGDIKAGRTFIITPGYRRQVYPNYHTKKDGLIMLGYLNNLQGTSAGSSMFKPDTKVSVRDMTPVEAQRYQTGSLINEIRGTQHGLTSGADPEVFAVGGDGRVLPAFEFLGPKDKGVLEYWDGYQAEFSPHAESCLQSLGYRIHECLSRMRLQLLAKDPKAKLTTLNTFDIPMERLEKDDPKFVKFGCSPSLSAYPDEINRVVEIDPFTYQTRCAGGHLHFGGAYARKDQADTVQWLDKTLGVISVALFRFWDTPQRRESYGRAGEYRTPPHGLEYRVLSNAWLASPTLYFFVFELARTIIKIARTPALRKQFKWDATEAEVRDCINYCDVDLALKILKRNEVMRDVLYSTLPRVQGDDSKLLWVRDFVETGAHEYLTNPREVRGWSANYSNYELRYAIGYYNTTTNKIK